MAKIVNYIASLGLPRGFPIKEYNPADGFKGLTDDGASEARVVDVINNYLHQKSGLVQGRDELVTFVEGHLAYPRKYDKVTKGTGDKQTTVEVPAEVHKTEQKYLDCFVADVAAGKFSVTGFTAKGDTLDAKEASVWAYLQSVVDKPAKYKVTFDGKTEEVELFNLENDIKAPERQPGGPKKLPQYAVNAAKGIISDTLPDGTPKKTKLADRLKKWHTQFTERGLTVEDFLSNAPAGATPEQVAAHEAERQNRLARAVVLNEEADRAANAKKYA